MKGLPFNGFCLFCDGVLESVGVSEFKGMRCKIFKCSSCGKLYYVVG